MFGIRSPQYSQRPSAFANDPQNFQQNYPDYQQNFQQTYPPNVPQRGFMSSIASIYADYDSNISHKRKMQQELAESLKRQIEEKKARSQMQENSLNRRSVQQQANEMLMQMQTNPNRTAPINSNYSQPPQSLNDISRTQPARKVTFASSQQNYKSPSSMLNDTEKQNNDDNLNNDTSKPFVYKKIPVEKFVPFRGNFYSDPPKHIQVSTESPFAHQSVATPPLGFSVRSVKAHQNMRNSYPSKQNMFGFQNSRRYYQTGRQTTFTDQYYSSLEAASGIKTIPTISQMYAPEFNTSFPG